MKPSTLRYLRIEQGVMLVLARSFPKAFKDWIKSVKEKKGKATK